MNRVTMEILGRFSDDLEANRLVWKGEFRRVLILKWAVCLAILSEIVSSPHLWFGERFFPRIPVIGVLPDLPVVVGNVLFAGFVVGLLAVLVLAEPKRFIVVTVGLGIALVAFDINRLQPWFYQYLLILAAFAFAKKPQVIVGVILSATYIWSGIQKLNMSFASIVVPDLFGDWLRPVWFLIPLFEVLVGVSLFIPRTRVVGIVGAILLHTALLFELGPLGRSLNSAIWPWNFWLIILALVVFAKNADPLPSLAFKSIWGKAFCALVVVMPAFNFLGVWDDYLSMTMYSGRSVAGYIFLTENGAKSVPQRLEPCLIHRPDRIGFDLYRWSMSELKVPSYPQQRVYQRIARSLVDMGIPESEMTLILTDRPGLNTTTSGVHTVPIR